MSAIRINGVSKYYGNTCAVDSLDVEIESSEFLSILGPSGCGKTTLLRMLAGLEQPGSGQIEMDGKVVNELPPSKRDIAMVFQTYALYPHMTVAGNIEYPLKKRKVAKQERKQRVAEAAALLQLEGLLRRKPRELSGGQQQRVALGRALVRNPAVFLLDEPLSNLDAKLRSHMRAELIQLHQRIGRTMIYVTHDQLEAMTMSDRIAVMRDGKLQQIAAPSEVYARPANRFVAGFIGTPAMNFVEGRLGDNASCLRSGDWSVSLAESLRPAAAEDGQLVEIGFRPEDLHIAESGMRATVSVVETVGHEIIVIFDYAGTEIVGRFSPDVSLHAQDVVHLAPRADRLHLFDAASGRRLNAG
ncbi:MAG: ABC transporter ATP-binding protein [Gammaproteobacteria bacterium]|nr:ABC transporter ATP-binding protein [Gammaproteobacteria bacterium]